MQRFCLQVKRYDSPDSLKNIKAQDFEAYPSWNVLQRMPKGTDSMLHKECLKEQTLFNLELEETRELFVLVYFHIEVRATSSEWFKQQRDVLVQGLKPRHRKLVYIPSSLRATLLCSGFLVSHISLGWAAPQSPATLVKR